MVDKLPMISVVMAVYNAEKYLVEAIQSILTQTHKDFEFIIINDGSTDKSLKIIEKYKNDDERIILINRENKGLIASLNEGIEKAKGKYIARMDADDISMPERFRKQLEMMGKENIDICGGHYFLIKEDSSINGLNLAPRCHDLCFLSLVSKVPFAHPSVMMRRDFLNNHSLRYGQSDYKIAEDLDLWIRMFENNAKFGNVDDVIFHYRVLEDSLSRVNRSELKEDTKQMMKSFLKKYKDRLLRVVENLPNNLNDEEKSLLVRFVWRYFKHSIDFKVFKLLKDINKKIVVFTLLSEIKNV